MDDIVGYIFYFNVRERVPGLWESKKRGHGWSRGGKLESTLLKFHSMPQLDDEQSVNMDKLSQLQDSIEQLLLIVKTAIVQLVQRSDFKQVSPDVPITKSRPKDKVDDPQKFEGRTQTFCETARLSYWYLTTKESKRELIADIILKAKQIEVLIESLPTPEPEEAQAQRFGALEQELQQANAEYKRAIDRASKGIIKSHF